MDAAGVSLVGLLVLEQHLGGWSLHQTTLGAGVGTHTCNKTNKPVQTLSTRKKSALQKIPAPEGE
jgi:hypothetical protein